MLSVSILFISWTYFRNYVPDDEKLIRFFLRLHIGLSDTLYHALRYPCLEPAVQMDEASLGGIITCITIKKITKVLA